jgi:hypothetical protein
MGSWWNALMELRVEYFLAFSPMLQIILKSKSLAVQDSFLLIQCRVLIATIRYLANCPCPQCFTKKIHAGALGTRVDDQRRSHFRVDTQPRQRNVETTRKFIFEQGRGVNSTYVNNILQEDSYTPTRVSPTWSLF